MTKILNIDQFAQVKRQLTYKGKTHDVLEVSVQKFIDNLAAAEKLEASSAAPVEEKTQRLSDAVNASVLAVLDSVPTFPEADLRALPIDALHAILKFIRGEMDPDTSQADTDAAEGAEKKPT